MQGAGCLPSSSPNAAPALVSLLWKQNPNHKEDNPEWGRSKGSEADLYEDALPFSLGEGVSQKCWRQWMKGGRGLVTGFPPGFIYLPLFYVFCLHVCLCERVKSWSYRQLWAAMWVLRFEPGSSEKEVSVPNHWAISPAPRAGILKTRIL